MFIFGCMFFVHFDIYRVFLSARLLSSAIRNAEKFRWITWSSRLFSVSYFTCLSRRTYNYSMDRFWSNYANCNRTACRKCWRKRPKCFINVSIPCKSCASIGKFHLGLHFFCWPFWRSLVLVSSIGFPTIYRTSSFVGPGTIGRIVYRWIRFIRNNCSFGKSWPNVCDFPIISGSSILCRPSSHRCYRRNRNRISNILKTVSAGFFIVSYF